MHFPEGVEKAKSGRLIASQKGFRFQNKGLIVLQPIVNQITHTSLEFH